MKVSCDLVTVERRNSAGNGVNQVELIASLAIFARVWRPVSTRARLCLCASTG